MGVFFRSGCVEGAKTSRYSLQNHTYNLDVYLISVVIVIEIAEFANRKFNWRAHTPAARSDFRSGRNSYRTIIRMFSDFIVL